MRDLIKDTSLAFIIRVAGATLAVVLNLILGKYFGPAGVGQFYLTLSVIAIVSVFSRMGTEISLTRFTAAHKAVEDYASLTAAYRKALKFTSIASFFGAVILFIIAKPLALFIFKNSSLVLLFRIGALAVMPFSLAFLHTEALKGLKKVVPAMAFLPHGGIIITPILIIALLYFGRDGTIGELVYTYCVATVLVMTGAVITWLSYSKNFQKAISKFTIIELLRSSFPLFVMSLMYLMLEWTGTFMLEIIKTSAEVGIFNVAYRLSTTMAFILAALSVTTAPRYAELYKLNQKDVIRKNIKNASIIGIGVALPILLVLLLFPHTLMGFFGEEFIVGASALQILAIGQFINVATGTIPHLLMMSGNEKYVMYNTMTGGILNLLLNILLIPYFSVAGAAIASSISIVVINLMAIWQVRYRLSLKLI